MRRDERQWSSQSVKFTSLFTDPSFPFKHIQTRTATSASASPTRCGSDAPRPADTSRRTLPPPALWDGDCAADSVGAPSAPRRLCTSLAHLQRRSRPPRLPVYRSIGQRDEPFRPPRETSFGPLATRVGPHLRPCAPHGSCSYVCRGLLHVGPGTVSTKRALLLGKIHVLQRLPAAKCAPFP